MTVMFENVAQVLASEQTLAGEAPVVSGGSLTLESGQRVDLAPELLIAVNALLTGLSAGKIGHVDLDEQLLSAERAGELLNVTRPTVYAWQDRGLIERVDRGGKRMVPLASALAYKAQQADRRAFAAANRPSSEPSPEQLARAQESFPSKVDVTGEPTNRTGVRTRGRGPIVAQ